VPCYWRPALSISQGKHSDNIVVPSDTRLRPATERFTQSSLMDQCTEWLDESCLFADGTWRAILPIVSTIIGGRRGALANKAPAELAGAQT